MEGPAQPTNPAVDGVYDKAPTRDDLVDPAGGDPARRVTGDTDTEPARGAPGRPGREPGRSEPAGQGGADEPEIITGEQFPSYGQGGMNQE